MSTCQPLGNDPVPSGDTVPSVHSTSSSPSGQDATLSPTAGVPMRQPLRKLQIAPYHRSHEGRPVRWMDPELSTWGPSHLSPWGRALRVLLPAVPLRRSAGHHSRNAKGHRWNCHPASLSPRWSRVSTMGVKRCKTSEKLHPDLSDLTSRPIPCFSKNYQGANTITANPHAI